MEFLALTLRTPPNGNGIWIKAVKETIEFFGWDRHYDVWKPKCVIEGSATCSYTKTGGSFAARGGQRLLICRSASKGGSPRGMTNAVRVHAKVCNRDLAELVALSAQPIAWMESRSHGRVSYDDWMALYLGTPYQRLQSFA